MSFVILACELSPCFMVSPDGFPLWQDVAVKIGSSLCVLALLVMSESNAPAQATAADWWHNPWLTGDWGGTREQLISDGITPYVYYTSIVIGNPVGGHEQVGPRYEQDISFGLTFDLQKLVGWDGATININGIDRFGKTIRREIGSVYDPVELYGGQTLFLYNLTLEQKFWHDIGSFKIGRFSPGDDFATSPLYGYYVSNGIDGQIRAVIDDTRFATYPFASWAARLRFDPTPEFNIMTGIFEISDQLTNHDRHGVNFGINDQDGYQLVQQFGWTPEFAKEPVNRDPKNVSAPKIIGLPGHYFVGGWLSNSDYNQFGTDVQDARFLRLLRARRPDGLSPLAHQRRGPHSLRHRRLRAATEHRNPAVPAQRRRDLPGPHPRPAQGRHHLRRDLRQL